MRLHVVSDVHGSTDELARAADGADALVCLGDLVLYLDYADPARGVFADLFNIMNSNTAVNLAWVSGATFERATTVLNPRIAKFGVKFDW